MALEQPQVEWLNRFTVGAIKLPQDLGGKPKDPLAALREELESYQAREQIAEQALKDAMLAKVFEEIDKRKEEIRKAFDIIAKVKNEKGKVEKQKFIDKRGQTKSFEAEDSGKLTEVPEGTFSQPKKTGDVKVSENGIKPGTKLPDTPEDFFKRTGPLDAASAYSLIVEQKKILAAKKVERHVVDERAGVIVTQTERLFTDDDIERELFTPLVRDLVIPDTIIENLYSNTQKMIDGSNKYLHRRVQGEGQAAVHRRARLRQGRGGAWRKHRDHRCDRDRPGEGWHERHRQHQHAGQGTGGPGPGDHHGRRGAADHGARYRRRDR